MQETSKASGKGEQTRAAILNEGLNIASVDGLGGLTIGALAARLGMSKSGLFAHFGSKEALQLAVLDAAVERVKARVILPARAQPPGEKQLQALFRGWLDWIGEPTLPGGCPIGGAVMEFDHQPGTLYDALLSTQTRWVQNIVQMVNDAIQLGEFRPDLDGQQFAFEFQGIGYSYHFFKHLLRHPNARALADSAFAALLARSRTHSG